jgi:Skp family chaperone for outer membrane proteins
MIKYALSVAFVATTLLLAACEKADEPTPEKTGSAAPGQTTPAGQPAGTAGEAQVTEAEAKLIAEMEALQSKVDELQKEATNKTAETQAAMVQQLNSLQHEREELKKKVDDLSDTGAAVAANVLNGLNQSLSILSRSVEMEPEAEMPAPETTTPADVQKP